MAAYKSYKPAVRKEIKNSFSRSEGWVYMSGHIQHYVLSPHTTTHRTFFSVFLFSPPHLQQKNQVTTEKSRKTKGTSLPKYKIS
jgi:hypothetical protein